MAKKKLKKYDVPTEIRRLARERVGAVPSPKLIVPKNAAQKAQAQAAAGRRGGVMLSSLARPGTSPAPP